MIDRLVYIKGDYKKIRTSERVEHVYLRVDLKHELMSHIGPKFDNEWNTQSLTDIWPSMLIIFE